MVTHIWSPPVTTRDRTLGRVSHSVRHGPGWPMSPLAGLGMGLGRAYNLEISTGSG